MPRGSKDGSIYKRLEKRVVYKGGKRIEKDVEVWYTRVRFTDVHGRQHEKKRRANGYAHACELKRQITAEVERELQLPAASVHERTFCDLGDYYREEYLNPPEYVAGRKVAGLRSYNNFRSLMCRLVAHFGECRLHTITYDDLRAFKRRRGRSQTPATKKEPLGHQRSIAAVDRELQLLRRMLNVALHKKWIRENPFQSGDSLISSADETKRMRILTRDEESRLLAACAGPRAHLRPIVIMAIDTAMRKGEILKLCWRDVQITLGIIGIDAFNTKTMQPRLAPITGRCIKS
jgi:hypothetical protein